MRNLEILGRISYQASMFGAVERFSRDFRLGPDPRKENFSLRKEKKNTACSPCCHDNLTTIL